MSSRCAPKQPGPPEALGFLATARIAQALRSSTGVPRRTRRHGGLLRRRSNQVNIHFTCYVGPSGLCDGRVTQVTSFCFWAGRHTVKRILIPTVMTLIFTGASLGANPISALVTASLTSGPTPQTVTFDGSQPADPSRHRDRADGIHPPPDFVAGPARAEVEAMIVEVMAELGCP
jgi:hypothetical protein